MRIEADTIEMIIWVLVKEIKMVNECRKWRRKFSHGSQNEVRLSSTPR